MSGDEYIEYLRERWNDGNLLNQVVKCLEAIEKKDQTIDNLRNFLRRYNIGGYESRMSFRGITISDIILSGVELNSIDLSHTFLQQVNFSDTKLEDCVLESARFHGGSFQKASMKGSSTFRNASMDVVDITPLDSEYVECERPWHVFLFVIGIIFLNFTIHNPYSVIYYCAISGQICYNNSINVGGEVSFTCMGLYRYIRHIGIW